MKTSDVSTATESKRVSYLEDLAESILSSLTPIERPAFSVYMAIAIRGLDHHDGDVRNRAAMLLLELCESAKKHVELLEAISENIEPDMRLAKIQELVTLLPDIHEALYIPNESLYVGYQFVKEDTMSKPDVHDDFPDTANTFIAEYPKEMPDRLAWLEDHLRLPRYRMLRIMGLTDEEAKRHAATDWKDLTRDHLRGTIWLHELLGELLGVYGHDWEFLANYLSTPKEQIEEESEQDSLAEPKSADALLAQVRRGGPYVLTHLLDYLRGVQPASTVASTRSSS